MSPWRRNGTTPFKALDDDGLILKEATRISKNAERGRINSLPYSPNSGLFEPLSINGIDKKLLGYVTNSRDVRGAALLADEEPRQVLVVTATTCKSSPPNKLWGYQQDPRNRGIRIKCNSGRYELGPSVGITKPS